MAHPDVGAEQAYIDHAYERLDVMRDAAESMLREAFGERGGTFQALAERDIRVRNSLNRLEHLQIGGEALVFGRIDREGADSGSGPESYHIGRLAVSDYDQEPLVVDWRAPVAEPFYRATGAHPMGLQRRRHFMTQGRRVLDLEDEVFDEAGPELTGRLGLAGPQVLLAALEQGRTGRMRDIVATVQREQDEIIRAPLPGLLVVQGGPGTGKTAVALHRAAYLLYTHRFPLESQGVLVVGPNPLFLRYIERVLPSLGETGVELSTVPGLFADAAVSAGEARTLTRLKGDPRMARLLARAVSDRQRPLRHAVEVPYGRLILRITPGMSAEVVAAAKRRAGSHNGRRRVVETLLWRRLRDQIEGREAREGAAADGEQRSTAELGRELRRIPSVADALDRMWPVLRAQELLHDLFGAPPLLDLAGRGLLDSSERSLLYRPRSTSYLEVPWTAADMALLDEARALLGPPRRRADPDDEIRSYGHIVVDEAQDLSPMELRMLARRSLSGSMTVVGDVAQATSAWAAADWSVVAEHLSARRGWRQVELTVNYRTPAEIMAVASPVLEAALPGMSSPAPVRHTDDRPRFISLDRDQRAQLVGVVGQELEAVTAAQAAGGTVGVIAPRSRGAEVARWLEEAGYPVGFSTETALDSPVSVMSVEDAKGLEFDSVVIVEPAAVVREAPQGLRSLYVALTRSTRRLAVLHAEPLPQVLWGEPAAAAATDRGQAAG